MSVTWFLFHSPPNVLIFFDLAHEMIFIFQQPGERPHAKQNEYETPAIIIPKKQIYGTPVDETYADMSQGSSCEATPLCPEDKKYENLDDGANNRASVMTQPADEFYEEVNNTKTTETMPLVSESYIVPDTIVKRK